MHRDLKEKPKLSSTIKLLNSNKNAYDSGGNGKFDTNGNGKYDMNGNGKV
ncbi:MAG: hypothetical protein ACD_20C00184G0005 [uncultured bacterium]|nr:MAG: hypothetical protein ACD_20C00184G0005 [uncultured bacterium]